MAKNGLAVNPFVNLTRAGGSEDADLVLVAPRSLVGLTSFAIKKNEQPGLHELFTDLAQNGMDLLDPVLDLDDEERQILVDNGILVPSDAIPEKALFSCLLDSVPPINIADASGLAVNPTFEYRALDFSQLMSQIWGGHLSGRPSAWVTEEVTQIERGYWFDHLADSEIVSKFEAGKPLPFEPFDVEPEFLGKLYAAGIVTTEEDIEERTRKNKAKLDAAHEKYVNDKYCVVEELLPPEQMAAMRTYFRKYISNGFMPFEDGQAVRYYQHNEPLARVFHKQLTDLMSYVIGEEVIPSYVYAGSYVEHADLNPHCDRAQCEFSISFQVDYLPEQPEHRSPWGLFVWQPDWTDDVLTYSSEEFPAASEAEDTNPAVYMRSGDGLIYKGRELIHYRYPLAAGHQSTSLFFHYVPKDFEGELR